MVSDMEKEITIIPAIDIIGGKCVRLMQGDYDRSKVYHDDPLEAARCFEAAGMERLHLVDLDGAAASIHSLKRSTALCCWTLGIYSMASSPFP